MSKRLLPFRNEAMKTVWVGLAEVRAATAGATIPLNAGAFVSIFAWAEGPVELSVACADAMRPLGLHLVDLTDVRTWSDFQKDGASTEFCRLAGEVEATHAPRWSDFYCFPSGVDGDGGGVSAG